MFYVGNGGVGWFSLGVVWGFMGGEGGSFIIIVCARANLNLRGIVPQIGAGLRIFSSPGSPVS